MTDRQHRRQPVPDRARKRAIRLHAARVGVPYLVAARQFGGVGSAAGMMPASHGRTIYPIGADTERRRLIDRRSRRIFAERVADARRAADLPHGRAAHLVERFPRAHAYPAVGVLYGGEARQEMLAMLYAVVIHERPDLEPSAVDLAWEAEMGEETAVDTACAGLDRAVRLLLDDERRPLWPRVEAAVRDLPQHQDRWGDGPELRRVVMTSPSDGVRQILDALLMVADDGHAPGTRVRMLSGTGPGRTGTITGATWGLSGPPIGYLVRPDGVADDVLAEPQDLLVLAGQGTE